MDDDASGLTFGEWDPTADVDDTQPPAAMIINSSELHGAGFNLKELLPPELEAAARGGKLTPGAGLVRQPIHGAAGPQWRSVTPSSGVFETHAHV